MLAPNHRTRTALRLLSGWIHALPVGTLMLAGIMAMLALRTPAHAQEPDETPDVVIEHIAVPFTTADLADATHRHALLKRLDRAALKVCGDDDGELPQIRAAIARSSCHRTSLLAAATQLHDTALTQSAQIMADFSTTE